MKRSFNSMNGNTSAADDKSVRRVGQYVLGMRLGNSPVRSIVQCLARRIGDPQSDRFFAVKILTLEDLYNESQDDRQGKMLLHTEYSLLSLLHDMNGVIHVYGLFKDEAMEEREVSAGQWFPFYDSVPQELFRKIKCAEYSVPKESRVSFSTISIIHKLLVLNPRERMTAEHVLDALQTSLALWLSTKNMISQLQVVPDIDQQLNTNNDNKSDEVTAKETKKLQLKGNELFVNNYKQIVDNRVDVPNAEPSTSGSHKHSVIHLTSGRIRTTPIGTLPIRRIESDAKPLTAQQLLYYKSLISNSNDT
ncbi:unnamed protein product [Medioppia subpectinata]|uniref:Protein kinase domain-containing protein n=1 Tax=Medioppia subpectinata TaxID=1979941 RepID=A0A7R9KGF0_9ACAR|nr:unnamed protein product [Medioppia subpectinata]CAG2101873.1 unnamed protein product [Medioppia subpectinata]